MVVSLRAQRLASLWLHQATNESLQVEEMPRKGYAFLSGGGDITELAKALSMGIVRRIPGAVSITKPRGAHKAFSFHWSNAQNAWDVMIWKDFPWTTDGAEFFVFTGRKALSPLGKTWSLAEMRYVAKKLGPHPGFASSPESAFARAASDQKWVVYLFSDTGGVLFEETFHARSERDAKRQGLNLVKPRINKFDNAEDWVVERESVS